MITFFDLMRNIVNALNAVVRIDEEQHLTQAQKDAALNNIGAASRDETVKLQQDLQKLTDDINYKPIEITALTCSVGTVELGRTIDDVTISWTLSKEPEAQMLGAMNLAPDVRRVDLTQQGITANRTFTLSASDERKHKATRSVSITFLNGVYWGAAAVPETLDSAFVLGLKSPTLTSTRARTITVDAAAGEYIWYALPVRLGKCSFAVGGFTGGFDLVDTIDFTNASGYTEQYYIYRSTNLVPGETKVVIS